MPSPEQIHPALWRATQLARGSARVLPTGHEALARQLPDGGWPIGGLTELLLPHAGSGELALLAPALAEAADTRPIALVHPPLTPHIAAWRQAGLAPERLLWVAPPKITDAPWAAEQILRHASCAALLCWLPQARPEILRRLHLAAQASDTLFFVLRPAQAAQAASPAPLRLALTPAPGGLAIHILKRRGPACAAPLFIALPAAPAPITPIAPYAHAPLDRPVPAPVAAR